MKTSSYLFMVKALKYAIMSAHSYDFAFQCILFLWHTNALLKQRKEAKKYSETLKMVFN